MSAGITEGHSKDTAARKESSCFLQNYLQKEEVEEEEISQRRE